MGEASRSIVAGRYFFLLTSLMVLGMLYPLLQQGPAARAIWALGLCFVLCGAWRAMQLHLRVRVVAIVLALVAVVSAIWLLATEREGTAATLPLALFAASNFAFLGLTAVVVLGDVLGGAREEVDVDKILGVVCAYVVIGVAFAFLFLLIHALQPGGAVKPEPHGAALGDYLYFSFATLTTVGYGDLAPAGSYARLFASVEAVTGMLYLTIVVARLVGLHIARSPSRKD